MFYSTNERAVAGDNSGDEDSVVANHQLKSIVDRIERLEENKKATCDDIKDVYSEAKSGGFDVKALREIVRRRKADAMELEAHEAIVETYMSALGMV